MSTEKYTIQTSLCTCHLMLFSLNKAVSWLFAWLPLLFFAFFLFFSLEIPHATWRQSKWHVDKGWVFLSPPSCFLSVKWKNSFGRHLRCGSYHDNLAVNSSWCGTLEWTKSLDRLIHRCLLETPPHPRTLPLVTTITLPSFLLSTLPSPWAAEVTGHKSQQTWAWGGWGGGVVGGVVQHKPGGDFSSCIESCFPLADNVSLGMLLLTHCMQSSLSYSLSLSLSLWISSCAIGV